MSAVARAGETCADVRPSETWAATCAALATTPA